ncbi:phage tail tube protein [Xanthobacter sediminis]
MTEVTSSYAKIYIGTTAPITWTSDATALTAFAADTYIEVKKIEDIGEFGDEVVGVEYSVIGESRKKRVKGTYDAGTFDLVCIRDSSDPGQQKLIDALKMRDGVNVKVTVNDAPAGGTPSTFYFTAMVMSAKVGITSADNMVKLTSSLAINTAILEVEAAEAD